MNHKDIRILHIFPLRGPSLWTYRPVLEAWVDIGDLEDFPSNTIPGFVDHLCAWLPTLVEHRCSYGEPGGFIRRLQEGTWPAHILEHITLELQNLIGMPGGYGRARETAQRSLYKVVVSAQDEDVTRACLFAARDLVMAAIEDRPYDLPATLAELTGFANSRKPDRSTQCILDAAASKERGIPAIRLSNTLVQLGYGARQRRIWGTATDRTGAIADGIARNPELTSNLLESCGLPVPSRERARSEEEACEAADDFGLPVWLKDGDFSPGETGRQANDADQLRMIYRELSANGHDVIVESGHHGPVHRLLLVNSQLLAAILLDPSAGRDVSDAVHASNVSAACLAMRVTGLDVAAIDIATPDISQPFDSSASAITAVHASPDLQPFLDAGIPSDKLGLAFADFLFPDGSNGRIPLVGVTGSLGTTEVSRLTAEFLRLSGKLTGLACSKGSFLNRRQLEHGNCADWQHARHILMNRSVEAAVIENHADVILGQGLAYDRCQVGVLTTIHPQLHLGSFHLSEDEHVFKVFRTQIDVVLPGGVAVLPAHEPMAVDMIPLCDGEVILFSAEPSLPALTSHLAANGRAVLVADHKVVLATGGQRSVLADLSTIPFLTSDSQPIRVAEVLAAVGAAWALGIPEHVICTGLETFSSHPANPDAPVPAKPAAPLADPL